MNDAHRIITELAMTFNGAAAELVEAAAEHIKFDTRVDMLAAGYDAPEFLAACCADMRQTNLTDVGAWLQTCLDGVDWADGMEVGQLTDQDYSDDPLSWHTHIAAAIALV